MKQRLSAQVAADKASAACYTNTDTMYRNPYAAANVNQAQGPRTGNTGAHAAKRGNFQDEKAARQPLADQIMSAFSQRAGELESNPGEHEMPESGGIRSNSQINRFAVRRSRARYQE
jgi:hypothetical protein